MTERQLSSRPILLATLVAVGLAACSEPNVYQAPPPPKVTVAHPEKRTFTDYMEFTGRTEAVASVDLRINRDGP